MNTFLSIIKPAIRRFVFELLLRAKPDFRSKKKEHLIAGCQSNLWIPRATFVGLINGIPQAKPFKWYLIFGIGVYAVTVKWFSRQRIVREFAAFVSYSKFYNLPAGLAKEDTVQKQQTVRVGLQRVGFGLPRPSCSIPCDVITRFGDVSETKGRFFSQNTWPETDWPRRNYKA